MFFDDLPNIHRRRERGAHDEVLNNSMRGKRPRYYLQNFHYQSGGWLTEDPPTCMTLKSKFFSMARLMPSDVRRYHNCMRYFSDGTNGS